MSAVTLKRAAASLRFHAEHAIQGKWLSLEGGDRLIAVTPDDDFEYLVTEEPAADGSTADYIALMHPPVALALADLLEEAAFVAEGNGLVDDDRYKAEAVLARAILREEAP